MITILCGRAKTGKTTQMYRRVSEGVKQRRRQLVIVPETRSHDHERKLLLQCGNRAGEYAQVTSFTKLSREILERAGVTAPVLDGGGRVLLMYRAVCSARMSLRYFKGEMRPELLCRLLAAADELKACMIQPDELLRVSGLLPDKLSDVANIYACYCALCQTEGFDGKDLVTQAAAVLDDTGEAWDADIYLDDFAGLTRQEYVLLSKLARRAHSMVCTLLTGEDEKLFAEQFKTLGRIQRMAENVGQPCETLRVEGVMQRTEELQYLEKHLFSFNSMPFQRACPAVALYDAADAAGECELAAALMRQKLLGGARAREMAVVCGNPDEYAEKLENACERYGVPVFVSRQQDILKKPAFLGALGGMRSLLDGMRPDTVLSWLKAGLSGLTREERERLESYVLLWNISGKRWESQWTLSPQGFSGGGQTEELCRLNALRERVWMPLCALREQLEQGRTGADFAQALLQSWQAAQLEERLNERVQALHDAKRPREAAEYAQLYDILRSAVDQFKLVAGGLEMDKRQFFGLLEMMLSQYDVGSIPISLDCVMMGDFERLSLDGVRHLFVLGARDGLLPPDAAGNTLLSEPERILLEGVGVELTQTAEERAFQVQSEVYHAFASAAESLSVLYPAALSDGSECRESYLVRRMRTLLPQLRMQSGTRTLARLALTARTPAYELACMAAGGGGGAEGVYALEKLSQDAQCQKQIAALRQYAVSPRGPVKKAENIRALYGDTVRMTASRVERAESCRFSYFMQYGLRARPVRAARFGAPEIGTFMHYIVEHAVCDLCSGRSGSPEQAAEHWAKRYIADVLGGTGDKTARLRGLLRALSRHAAAVVRNVWEEICASDFVPLAFEMNFGAEGAFAPLALRSGNITLQVGGKIDRVDGYVKGDCLYLKVVDYKTGSKKFKLSDVLYGLNMQMFLYLLMLEQGASSELLRLASEKSGMQPQKLMTAGALYVPAKDPFVPVEQGEQAEKIGQRLDKIRQRIGLVSSEPDILQALEHAENGKYRFLPVSTGKTGALSASSAVASAEQFGRLLHRVENTLKELCSQLACGDIEATPHGTEKGRSICDYCDYRAACHFDESMKKDKLRWFAPMKDVEVHALLEEEEKHGS